jgi:beta-galactosidase
MKTGFLKLVAFLRVLSKPLWTSFLNTFSQGILKFTKDGEFILANGEQFKNPGFDFSVCQNLNLPRDWRIEGEFCRENPASSKVSTLPGGFVWYRKLFFIPETDNKKLSS